VAPSCARCARTYLPYEEVDGRGLGKGVIESLFEAQVWTNYSEKQKKDMLDLAAKIIFQTTDGNIAAQNVLTDSEVGQIVSVPGARVRLEQTGRARLINFQGNHRRNNAVWYAVSPGRHPQPGGRLAL
jgi:hypothetical protein